MCRHQNIQVVKTGLLLKCMALRVCFFTFQQHKEIIKREN